MIYAVGTSLVGAYNELLVRFYESRLCEYPVPCPDYNTSCHEVCMATMAVFGGEHRDKMSVFGIHTPDSLKKYVNEMLCGTMDWAVAEGKEPYTYHQRYDFQLEEAINLLREHPDTRRAMVTIRNEADICHDDQPCLTSMQFLVRSGELHMFVHFRSNDLWQALYMNAYALMELQRLVANRLGVEVGDYYHTVNSLHVYERDWERLKSAVDKIIDGERTYISAEDYWEAR